MFLRYKTGQLFALHDFIDAIKDLDSTELLLNKIGIRVDTTVEDVLYYLWEGRMDLFKVVLEEYGMEVAHV